MTAVIAGLRAQLATNTITETVGGLTGRMWNDITDGSDVVVEPTPSKEGKVEFLGFSRIDGYPMFRAYRQMNTSHTDVGSAQANWGFDPTRNTFSPTMSMASQITDLGDVTLTDEPTIELVSALEDHIPGFSANWMSDATGPAGNYPMDR